MLLVDDVLEGLLADAAVDLPGGERVALGEDVLDLLERAAGRLGEAEEDVDEGRKVERAEDEVRLVRDRRQARRHRPREREVEEPVRRGRDGDGLGAHAHREDLRGVRPRDGAHGDGEGADEEVGADDDALGDALVVVDDPDACGSEVSVGQTLHSW